MKAGSKGRCIYSKVSSVSTEDEPGIPDFVSRLHTCSRCTAQLPPLKELFEEPAQGTIEQANHACAQLLATLEDELETFVVGEQTTPAKPLVLNLQKNPIVARRLCRPS